MDRLGVILAATRGSGIDNTTSIIPRPLLPVGPDVLIGHHFSVMRDLGIRKIFVVVNYKQQEIERFVSSREWDIEIGLVRQEDLSGTATALATVIEKEDSPLLVFNGDVVFSKRDVETLLREHEKNKSTATLGAVGTDEPEKYGILKIVQDRIVGIVEKPDRPLTHLANAGVYALEPEVEKYVSRATKTGKTSLTEVIDLMIGENQRVFYSLFNQYWYELSSLDAWISASQQKTRELVDSVSPGKGIVSHGGSGAPPGVSVEPPVMLGSNVEIGDGTSITGPALVSTGARVGRDSRIHSSMIHENALVGDSVVLEDTIVMPGARVLSGTIARRSVLF